MVTTSSSQESDGTVKTKVVVNLRKFLSDSRCGRDCTALQKLSTRENLGREFLDEFCAARDLVSVFALLSRSTSCSDINHLKVFLSSIFF